MLYLAEKDILKAVSVQELLDAVEASMRLYETGEFHMPQRLHVDHGGNTLLLMPCFTADCFGTKLVTLFPRNPELSVPVLNGVMVLNDARTGVPVALLNGPVLTALRTAAVSAVSIRHLAPEGARSLGIIGAGVQAFYQVQAACAARKFTHVFVFDLVSEETSSLIDKLPQELPHVKFHGAKSVEGLLKESAVIITATTSPDPVLPDKEELLEGRHFAGIGSYKPNMREFPKALFGLLDAVYVDTDHALEESGDLIVPLQNGWITKDQVVTFGRFLLGDRPKEKLRRQTTLFKSVGMALFDVCASKLIYDNALEKGLGQEIAL